MTTAFALVCLLVLVVAWLLGVPHVRDAGGIWVCRSGCRPGMEFVPWPDRLWKGYTEPPHDKAWHTAAAGITCLVGVWLFRVDLVPAVIVTSLAWLLVEVAEWQPPPQRSYPHKRRGHFSWRDLVANEIGVAAAALLVSLVRLVT